MDKALRSSVEWDAVRLQGEFSAEREAAARRTRLARDTLQKEKREQHQRKLAAKDLKLKQSHLSFFTFTYNTRLFNWNDDGSDSSVYGHRVYGHEFETLQRDLDFSEGKYHDESIIWWWDFKNLT